MRLDVVQVDINKLVEQLKQIGGPLASKAWEVYVRQQYVIGMKEILFAAILGAASVYLVNHIEGWFAKAIAADSGSDEEFGYTFAAVVGSVASVFAALACVFLGSDGIGHFINPEYGAIQALLGR